MTLAELKEKRANIENDYQNHLDNMETIKNETLRVQNVAGNAAKIFDELDKEFEQKTGLTKIDCTFLFFAVALQVARQYLFTKFPIRQDDQTAAKNTPGHHEEHSDRDHWYYNPTLEQILTNPVPFDANVGSNGALAGAGKLGHRAAALGHDPVLGLIVGTSNIATSTLTTWNFQSFHIRTNDLGKDFFSEKAKTHLVFQKTFNKLFSEGLDGKEKVALSLAKEIIHLKSDINTKNSLPLPLISSINPKIASSLAKYGLDMENLAVVGKQIAGAALVNLLIAMTHGLFYFCNNDSNVSKDLYEVRTRKILSYSNIIASVSNLAVVGITQNLNLLDVGGFIVTLHRIYTDQKFIHEVKRQFLLGNFNKMIEGEELKLV